MKLKSARVQNYRSIRDTEEFEIEPGKTILVGPNEAGKTVLLQALQQIHAPEGVKGFDPLRDYPRALYNEITTGKVDPAEVTVVEARFELDDEDRAEISQDFQDCTYVFDRRLDNSCGHRLEGCPAVPKYGDVREDLVRLASHIDARTAPDANSGDGTPKPSEALASITAEWKDATLLSSKRTKPLRDWLDEAVLLVDEANTNEEERLDRLRTALSISDLSQEALRILKGRIPVFVLFNNYFRVCPIIHLGHLAQRLASGILDDDQYDYGNSCLLKLLGFTAEELSGLGRAADPDQKNSEAMNAYRNQLDRRSYQLNAASVRLTREIVAVWLPDPGRQGNRREKGGR